MRVTSAANRAHSGELQERTGQDRRSAKGRCQQAHRSATDVSLDLVLAFLNRDIDPDEEPNPQLPTSNREILDMQCLVFT
jgi:hypothetical protein